MTREEAIAKLKEKRQIFIDEWADLDDIVEAFDMAISALSAEPSDLISRADAIEAVCNAMCEEDAPYYPECDQKQYCLEIQALKALPSAEPKIIKVRKDGTLFVKVLDVSKVHKVEVYDNGDLSKQFGCSADSPTEDYSDLPDIPRAYYEKIVGNMSHEINMLKQQLEDRPSGEWIKDYEKNIYKCSVCGCEEVVPTCMGEPTIWKYCPNCGSVIGARMKGGGE